MAHGRNGPHRLDDPISPRTWTPLPGTSMPRKLAGYPTGTKLCLHVATVRFGMQSAWSVPCWLRFRSSHPQRAGELLEAGAFRVYRDTAELDASLDELGVLP